MVVKIPRNNTSFAEQLFQHFKTLPWVISGEIKDEYGFLKYYQNLVRHFVTELDVGSRGLLIQHDVGLGKSIVAIAIAIDLIKTRPCIVLLTKSLEANMRGTIVKYVKLRSAMEPDFYLARMSPVELDDWIDRNFSFVAMNASNMMTQMGRAATGDPTATVKIKKTPLDRKIERVLSTTLNGKLLIVDEAHNLFRAITNGSKNALELYDVVMKSKDLRLMFFTGTPITNDPFELVPCFNMLSGPKPLFPENYTDFQKYYVDAGTIKNKEKFQNRIVGLVSRVSHKSQPGRGVGVTVTLNINLPKEHPLQVVMCPMKPDQYTIYQLARDKEISETKIRGPSRDAPSMTKPKMNAASTYRVKTRQLSNFCAPKHLHVRDPQQLPLDVIDSPKFEAMLKNIDKYPDSIGLVYSQFIGVGGLGTFARYLIKNGWTMLDYESVMPAATKQAISVQKEKDVTFIENEDDPDDVDVVSADLSSLEGDEPDEQADAAEQDNTGRTDVAEQDSEADRNDDTEQDSEADAEQNDEVSGAYEDALEQLDAWRELNKAPDVNKPGLSDAYYSQFGRRSRELVELTKSARKYRGGGGVDNPTDNDIATAIAHLDEEFRSMSWNYDITGSHDIVVDDLIGGDEIVGGAAPPKRSRVFTIISGDVPTEVRAKIRDIAADRSNARGQYISLVLVSSTGAEGLDLTNLRHIHIMEPYWTHARILQIIGRGVRTNSHNDLPPEERDVTPYIYLAVPPDAERVDGMYPPTTDTEIYEKAHREYMTAKSFLGALEEVSIECMINGEQCRTCAPTDQPLFSDSPYSDIKAPDPCEKLVVVDVSAKPVTFNGVTFYYVPDKTSIYGFKVFSFDPALNKYKPMRESDPNFGEIIEKIEAM